MVEIIVYPSRYMGIADLTMTISSDMDAFPGYRVYQMGGSIS